MRSNKFEWNEPIGVDRGDQFLCVEGDNPDAYVKTLKVYMGPSFSPGVPNVIKAIEVTWSDGTYTSSNTIGKPEGEAHIAEFAQSERISACWLWQNAGVAGMEYKSDRWVNGTKVGNANGTGAGQRVGSGKLAGFHGKHNGDAITTMGTVFWSS